MVLKSIEASKRVNIEHFVLVSSFDTRRSAFEGDLKPYTIAKHYADDHLRNLNFLIQLYILALTNNEGTGKVEIAGEVERGEVLAKMLLQLYKLF